QLQDVSLFCTDARWLGMVLRVIDPRSGVLGWHYENARPNRPPARSVFPVAADHGPPGSRRGCRTHHFLEAAGRKGDLRTDLGATPPLRKRNKRRDPSALADRSLQRPVLVGDSGSGACRRLGESSHLSWGRSEVIPSIHPSSAV